MGLSALEKYTLPNYRRYALAPVRGKGSYVYDEAGKAYLDYAGGVAVCPLGHCHPEVVSALQQQAETLIHISNWYQIPSQGELAKTLVEDVIQVPGKCFFGNSGAEANEGLIKFARRFGELTPQADGTPRHEILTFTGSFHGRTFATMTATAQQKIHGGFGPLIPGFKYLPFNDLEALKSAITPNTVAILLEPVQGESGVNPATPEFLALAAQLRDEHNLLLLFDEIQCGLGRTGSLMGWKSINDQVVPDGVSWAKSIGSGYALGSFWLRDAEVKGHPDTRLCDILGPGSHGSTYGGSPLACAVANATLRVILRDHLAEAAKKAGDYVKAQIEAWQHPAIKAVRAHGCMIGIEFDEALLSKIEEFQKSGLLFTVWAGEQLIEKGLLIVPAGPVVTRWLPPMNTTEDELNEALGIFKSFLNQNFTV